jgi:predicted house-cleaning noncanonical NTP pyrophosphatase (MazG superfamily)
MSPEERQTMNRLCQRIQEEKDSHSFDKLVKELNDLLEVAQDNPARPHTEPEWK